MQPTHEVGTGQPFAVQHILHWLYRLAALYCLAFGLFYWARLIGFHEGAGWRFDLMPVHWQVACTALGVLFPFAASGLWMLASWGPVIWFICAVGETVMFIGFPELFGANLPVVAVHGATALAFIVLRAILYLQMRASRD